MKNAAWPQALAELRAQWEASLLLRMGLLGVLLLVSIEGLFRLEAYQVTLREKLQMVERDNADLRVQLKQQGWQQRRHDAQLQLDALQAMLWQADDESLAQAAVQDWLRGAASKAPLILRELSVAPQSESNAKRTGDMTVEPASPAAAKAPQRADVPLAGGGGVVTVRARASFEFKRLPLMLLLSQVAAHERVLAVDRLHLKLAERPAMVELDLHALVAMPETKP